MISLILHIATLFFVEVLCFNLNKDMEDLAEEEIERQMFWNIFGPIIAIALINIIGLWVLI